MLQLYLIELIKYFSIYAFLGKEKQVKEQGIHRRGSDDRGYMKGSSGFFYSNFVSFYNNFSPSSFTERVLLQHLKEAVHVNRSGGFPSVAPSGSPSFRSPVPQPSDPQPEIPSQAKVPS